MHWLSFFSGTLAILILFLGIAIYGRSAHGRRRLRPTKTSTEPIGETVVTVLKKEGNPENAA